ncbi:ABC transporter substrate-binding protein [Marinobacter sp. P4B1]|nr:ABC transporter substrate-binding protein [Marinobacter sp. P4B1]
MAFWLLLCFLWMASKVQAAAITHPVAYIEGSGNAALDQHMTNLVSKELDGQVDLVPLEAKDLPLASGRPVIAIGPAAFSGLLDKEITAPIIALLVEKQAIENYLDKTGEQLTAVFYDVPLLRQALTGKAILPQATRVSVLATLDSADMYEPLIEQLPTYGLEGRMFIVSSDDQLIPSLNRALTYGDFVLAGLDDKIYNPRNIKHILLTAYRRNRILIGPSQAYVKAGALASSYAPFTTMAKQTADYLLAFFETGKLPAPAYPDEYRVEVNQQVARSLNIPLPDREWIAQAVDRFIQEQQEAGE